MYKVPQQTKDYAFTFFSIKLRFRKRWIFLTTKNKATVFASEARKF